MAEFRSLAEAACAVLGTADPSAKTTLSDAVAKAWVSGDIPTVGNAQPPDRPARPDKPVLLPPNKMPRRRKGGTVQTRVALLHAIAHIEFNAIDLAWDLIARFTDRDLPRGFYDDWTVLAAEEARHFRLVRERLQHYGADYGDLPAHDGLWQAAEATADDLMGRLAVVPLVLEARGLDVTPAMIGQLRAADDADSAAVLEIIYRDEICHVGTGKHWFDYLCAHATVDSQNTWQALVRRYFRGHLKPPFNAEARNKAGFPGNYYEPLTF